MACGCTENILQRTLFYPITELDKLEHELAKKNGYCLTVLPDWKQFSFLANYSSFEAPSQTVLAAMAIGQLKQSSQAETLSFLAGLRYPLLITLLAEVEIDAETCQKALANSLSEAKLIALLQKVI